jgi:hypothetical protein
MVWVGGDRGERWLGVSAVILGHLREQRAFLSVGYATFDIDLGEGSPFRLGTTFERRRAVEPDREVRWQVSPTFLAIR